jgi:hypothetical protein
MRKTQKGFILPLVALIIAALVIGAGVYLYLHSKSGSSTAADSNQNTGGSQGASGIHASLAADANGNSSPVSDAAPGTAKVFIYSVNDTVSGTDNGTWDTTGAPKAMIISNNNTIKSAESYTEEYVYDTQYSGQCNSTGSTNDVIHGQGGQTANNDGTFAGSIKVTSNYSPASTVVTRKYNGTGEDSSGIGYCPVFQSATTTATWAPPIINSAGTAYSMPTAFIGSYSFDNTENSFTSCDSSATNCKAVDEKHLTATLSAVFKMAVSGSQNSVYAVTLDVAVATTTWNKYGDWGANPVASHTLPTIMGNPVSCDLISVAGVTATSSGKLPQTSYYQTNQQLPYPTNCIVTLNVKGGTTLDVTPTASSTQNYFAAVGVDSVSSPKSLLVFLPGAGNETDGIFGKYGRMTDLENYLSTTIPNFSSNYDTLYVPYSSLTNSIAQDVTALDTALKNLPNLSSYQHIYIINHSLGYVALRNAVLNANGSACAAGSGSPEQVAIDPVLKAAFSKATMINLAPLLGSGDSPLAAALTQYILPADSHPDSAFSECVFSGGNDSLFNSSVATSYDYTVSSVGSVVTGGTPKNPTKPAVMFGDGDPALDGVWDYMAVNKGYECTAMNSNLPAFGPLTHENPPTFYNPTKDAIWYNDYEGALAPHHISYYGVCILPGEGNALFDMTQMNTGALSPVTFANNLHFILLEYKPTWQAVLNVLEGK